MYDYTDLWPSMSNLGSLNKQWALTYTVWNQCLAREWLTCWILVHIISVSAAAVWNLQQPMLVKLLQQHVLPVSQMPLCHHAAIQRVTTVQRRLLKSLQSVNWWGPDVLQQLTEGKHGVSSQKGSILHVGQHLPVQLLRLPSSTSVRLCGYSKKRNILVEVAGSQPPLAKLSGSHMVLAGDELWSYSRRMWYTLCCRHGQEKGLRSSCSSVFDFTLRSKHLGFCFKPSTQNWWWLSCFKFSSKSLKIVKWRV